VHTDDFRTLQGQGCPRRPLGRQIATEPPLPIGASR
jgi:hypothetical protein